MAPWGAASFDNDAAGDWFLIVEEGPDSGAVIAATLDDASSEADELGLELGWQTIAAAELCASCAGEQGYRLPDRVLAWVQANPHRPHDAEISRAIEAVTRVRSEGELRELWDARAEGEDEEWLREVDDLIARLRRCGAGDPPAASG